MVQTVLITGASSGIGKSVAISLGQNPGYCLILIGRKRMIEKRFANSISRDSKVDTYSCDLSSLREVKALADKLISSYSRIDVIINNAGARFDEYRKSEDGIELTFATNHLGHFLLTTQLFEGLANPPERVINVSSSAHHQAQPELGWNLSKHSFNRKIAYANSKLANILFTKELGRRLSSVQTICVAIDPGPTATRYALNNGWVAWFKHLISHKLKGDLQTAAKGADTVIYLATQPISDTFNGKLFRSRKLVEPSALANDPVLADQLWNQSRALTNLGSLA